MEHEKLKLTTSGAEALAKELLGKLKSTPNIEEIIIEQTGSGAPVIKTIMKPMESTATR